MCDCDKIFDTHYVLEGASEGEPTLRRMITHWYEQVFDRRESEETAEMLISAIKSSFQVDEREGWWDCNEEGCDGKCEPSWNGGQPCDKCGHKELVY